MSKYLLTFFQNVYQLVIYFFIDFLEVPLVQDFSQAIIQAKL